MAKKKQGSKKQSVSSAKPRSYSAMYKDDNTIPKTKSVDSAPAGASVTEKKGSDQVDWKNDYAYVFSDLRVLSIVSVVLFAIIIGLGFVI